MLPDEVALLVLSSLSWESLLTCSAVCKRWRNLAEDQTLWRRLCAENQWEWNQHQLHTSDDDFLEHFYDSCDDEGMGDEEDAQDDATVEQMLLHDLDLSRMDIDTPQQRHGRRSRRVHHADDNPDYRLLFHTHLRLKHRFSTSMCRLSILRLPRTLNDHNNTVYCLKLYTYPDTGRQVLFTGSKDRTIREWDLASTTALRVFKVHTGSVLSICLYDGMLVSGGSDCAVIVWDLATGSPITTIRDNQDSILCVKVDDKRLVTCSKGLLFGQRLPLLRLGLTLSLPDCTIRTYLLPDMMPEHVLIGHRSAVNSISLSRSYLVSASGDRSIKVWDTESGKLLRNYENHHVRG